jgi:hypothetical protein
MKNPLGSNIAGLYAFLAGATAAIAIGLAVWFYIGQNFACGGHL